MKIFKATYVLLVLVGGVGCSAVEGGSRASAEVDDEALSASLFGPVGTIWSDVYGASEKVCDATLIAPDRILTAGCIGRDNDGVVTGYQFRLGGGAAGPVRSIPIVRAFWANPSPTIGAPLSSVTVATLASAITDVAPMPIGALTGARVGERFLVAGTTHTYRDNLLTARQAQTVRTVGSATARALEGDRPWRKIYPTRAALAGLFGLPETDELVTSYWNYALGADEALLGGAPGDDASLPADRVRDLGGAIVARLNGIPTLVGVITAVGSRPQLNPDSVDTTDRSLWVSVFGPRTSAFVTASAGPACPSGNWTDPTGCVFGWSAQVAEVHSSPSFSSSFIGKLEATCVNGRWTNVVHECRPALPCPAASVTVAAGCTYSAPQTPSGSSYAATNTASGHTGEAVGICHDGRWSIASDTCR